MEQIQSDVHCPVLGLQLAHMKQVKQRMRCKLCFYLSFLLHPIVRAVDLLYQFVHDYVWLEPVLSVINGYGYLSITVLLWPDKHGRPRTQNHMYISIVCWILWFQMHCVTFTVLIYCSIFLHLNPSVTPCLYHLLSKYKAKTEKLSVKNYIHPIIMQKVACVRAWNNYFLLDLLLVFLVRIYVWDLCHKQSPV